MIPGPSTNDHRAIDLRDPALVRAEAEITQSRDQVARSLLELQRELARVVDWREWIRRKPVVAVSLAFALGLLIGRWRERSGWGSSWGAASSPG